MSPRESQGRTRTPATTWSLADIDGLAGAGAPLREVRMAGIWEDRGSDNQFPKGNGTSLHLLAKALSPLQEESTWSTPPGSRSSGIATRTELEGSPPAGSGLGATGGIRR